MGGNSPKKMTLAPNRTAMSGSRRLDARRAIRLKGRLEGEDRLPLRRGVRAADFGLRRPDAPAAVFFVAGFFGEEITRFEAALRVEPLRPFLRRAEDGDDPPLADAMLSSVPG